MGKGVAGGWESGLWPGKVGAEPFELGEGAFSRQGLLGQLVAGAPQGASGSSQGAQASG